MMISFNAPVKTLSVGKMAVSFSRWFRGGKSVLASDWQAQAPMSPLLVHLCPATEKTGVKILHQRRIQDL